MVVLNASGQQGKTARQGQIGWPFFLLTLCLLSFCWPVGSRAQTPVSKEYQIKAAFLFNFAQFVEWPPQTYTNADQPFIIGVLGEDPFGPALDQTVQDETIHTRKLIVRRSQRPEDLHDCQLVFICKSEKSHVADILPKFAGRRILTVSELPGFASSGGMINFYLDGSKVRFEINPTSAQRSELRISSQLLSLGKLIASDSPKEN
jgi:YfiR/HmsC-like